MSRRRNYTNRLTDEVLCMVFDRLDLENVKNASLTCRRWNNIIFSSGYVDRFSLNVAIMDLNVYPEPVISEAELDHNIINYRSTYDHLRGKKKILIKRHFPCRVEPDKQNQIFKQLVEIITKTKRRYRHLCWDIDEFMNRKFQTMWQAIHPKLTNNLATLEIYFTGASLLFVYDTLAEAIPLMPKLNELALLDEEYHAMVEQDRTLIFRSQTIERLTLNFDYRSSIEMPKLRFYEGAFNALHLPQGSVWPLELELMNHLSVVRQGKILNNSSVFHRLPNLRKIRWDIPLGHSMFLSICKRCTFLEELCIYHWLSILKHRDLMHLYKLKNLNRLAFLNIKVGKDFDFINSGFDYDFSKFIKLSELDLGAMNVAVSTLLSLPKSITTLGIRVYSSNQQSLIETITRNLTHLTELRLTFNIGPSPETLKSLCLLENLKVLEFARCDFRQSTFLQVEAPLHRLETLRFRFCRFDTEHLLRLQQNFPTLNEPEFISCLIRIKQECSYVSKSDEIDSESYGSGDSNLSDMDYDSASSTAHD